MKIENRYFYTGEIKDEKPHGKGCKIAHDEEGNLIIKHEVFFYDSNIPCLGKLQKFHS